MLSVGIVGLPNVGKSTLFNALLKKESALAANYPFATIDPNVGIVDVPDPRLAPLADIVKTTVIVPATVEFYDIAGLVRGASQGEGLGNKFLSHIRETALICHVVRMFEDGDIIHVEDTPDPVRDIQTIETELILADLATLTNKKQPKGAASKEALSEWETVQYLIEHLNKGISARMLGLFNEQTAILKSMNLLSLKPVLYVFNVSENQLLDAPATEARISQVLQEAGVFPADFIYMNAKLEQEIVALDQADQAEYMSQFGITQPGLDLLIQKAYSHLGLISFLTAGEKEVRAWTIPLDCPAPQAAGTIHTDFEKKFIKAEIVKYDDFISTPGWTASKEQGKMTLAGKDYLMQDGDVVEFKVGA